MSPRPQRILVVSDDDVCAAPLVAAVLRSELADREVEVAVTSAGTEAELGRYACELAVSRMPDREASDADRSIPINADLIRRADLVVVMDREQRAHVNRLAPGRQHTVFTLREAVSLAGGGRAETWRTEETVAGFAEALHRRRGLTRPRRLPLPRRGLLRRRVAAIDVDDLLEAHRLDAGAHVWALGQTRSAAKRLGESLRARLAAQRSAA